MSFKHLKQLSYLLVSIFLTLGLSLSFQSLLAAWTPPTSAPPNGNVSAPLNESGADQVKLGGLGLGGNFTVSGNSSFSGAVGIGTSAPNSQAHFYQITGANAELDIQSVSGANKHWAIYHDRTSDDLRFWNNTPAAEKNILTITNEGRVGVGTANPGQILTVAGLIESTNGGIKFPDGSIQTKAVSLPTCAENQYLQWKSGAWACSNQSGFYIRENIATDQSCDAICASYGETCAGIGTDGNATNWRYIYGEIIGAGCFNNSASGACVTVMSFQRGTCEDRGVRRTNCRCRL